MAAQVIKMTRFCSAFLEAARAIKPILTLRSLCGIYPVEMTGLIGRSQAMYFKERIGLNIQNLRYSNGLSQEQLALAAQIDRSYISEIEHAKSSVTADKMEQIARALGVDPSELTLPRHCSVALIEKNRLSAKPVAKINCIETGMELGLLYQWENGETQVALYEV